MRTPTGFTTTCVRSAVISDVMLVLAVLLIVLGVGLLSMPAAFVVGGVILGGLSLGFADRAKR